VAQTHKMVSSFEKRRCSSDDKLSRDPDRSESNFTASCVRPYTKELSMVNFKQITRH
jgi:hypothetical protein